MSVGQQATSAGINTQLTSLALNLRAACRAGANFQEFIVGQGLAGLEAMGFSPADAQTVLNMASYMNTVSGVYFGTVSQGTNFSFDNALSQLWAGQ
jgi:hypothetical protein